MMLIELVKLNPIKYWVIGGTQTKGWWIFKYKASIYWIEGNNGLYLGPFNNYKLAIAVLSALQKGIIND